MHLSIRTKLFLTLLIVSTLAVLGMQAFMRWSFHNGLMELAESRQQQRVDLISERLLDRYREDGGWERLAADKRLWLAALLGRGGDLSGRRGPPDAAVHGRGERRYGPRMRHALGEPGVWPPTPIRDHNHRQDRLPPRLEMRLMLLDASGKIIYGRQALIEGTLRFPLRIDGERVGELALIAGPYIQEPGDLRFKARQTTALAVIALGMILLSAAFAFPLSMRLSRPVQGFQSTARDLATGDFSARVPVTGDDEFGRLGRDINALAESLERNEQARRRWVADISHELRTPLTLLRAEIEAMQDGVRPLDRAAMDALHGDVLRLGRLVDDLYELSMTDLGALSYRKTETDLAEVLEAELAGFRAELKAAGLDLTLDNRLPEPVTLPADEQRLSQLFRNLLRNSLQYTDAGGSLCVTLSREAEELLIDFQDTPPGVPVPALESLFERLYRVEGSRGRNTGGAGLGLAICRNIVEAHGGTIKAHPSPSGGLWVRIVLPLSC